jgi:hypothetical protein
LNFLSRRLFSPANEQQKPQPVPASPSSLCISALRADGVSVARKRFRLRRVPAAARGAFGMTAMRKITGSAIDRVSAHSRTRYGLR